MGRVVVTEDTKRDVRAIIPDLHRIAGHYAREPPVHTHYSLLPICLSLANTA